MSPLPFLTCGVSLLIYSNWISISQHQDHLLEVDCKIGAGLSRKSSILLLYSLLLLIPIIAIVVWNFYDTTVPFYDTAMHMLRCYNYADLYKSGALLSNPILLLQTSHLYPPAYYIFGGLIIWVFGNPALGDPIWIAPFLRVFYLVILMGATYWLTICHFQNSRQAALTALLIALSPAVTSVCHGNLLDLPSLSLIVLSMASISHCVKSQSLPAFLFAAFSLAACLLMKHTSAPFVFLFLGWFFVDALRKKDYRLVSSLLAVGLAGLIALLSWYAANWSEFVQFVEANKLVNHDAINLQVERIKSRVIAPWVRSVSGLVIALGLAALFLIRRKNLKELSVILISIVVLAIFALCTFLPFTVNSQWQSMLLAIVFYLHPYRFGVLFIGLLVAGLVLATREQHRTMMSFTVPLLAGLIALAVMTSNWVPHSRYAIAVLVPIILYAGLGLEKLLSGGKNQKVLAYTMGSLILATFVLSNFSPYPISPPQPVQKVVSILTCLIKFDGPSPAGPNPDYNWGQAEVMKMISREKQVPPGLLIFADVAKCSTSSFLYLRRLLNLENVAVEAGLVWNTNGYTVKKGGMEPFGWFLFKDGEVISGFYARSPELLRGLKETRERIESKCELVLEKQISAREKVYLYRLKVPEKTDEVSSRLPGS